LKGEGGGNYHHYRKKKSLSSRREKKSKPQENGGESLKADRPTPGGDDERRGTEPVVNTLG